MKGYITCTIWHFIIVIQLVCMAVDPMHSRTVQNDASLYSRTWYPNNAQWSHTIMLITNHTCSIFQRISRCVNCTYLTPHYLRLVDSVLTRLLASKCANDHDNEYLFSSATLCTFRNHPSYSTIVHLLISDLTCRSCPYSDDMPLLGYQYYRTTVLHYYYTAIRFPLVLHCSSLVLWDVVHLACTRLSPPPTYHPGHSVIASQISSAFSLAMTP